MYFNCYNEYGYFILSFVRVKNKFLINEDQIFRLYFQFSSFDGFIFFIEIFMKLGKGYRFLIVLGV